MAAAHGDEAAAQINLDVHWQEGNQDDFSELHDAIDNLTTQKYDRLGRMATAAANPDAAPAGPMEPYRSQEDEEDDSSEDDTSEPPADRPGARLLWAAQYGHLDRVRALLDEKPELLSFRDLDGYTAFHRAAYGNHVDVLRHLLDRDGADLHILTMDSWTPLHSACRWNAFECVELLLSRGANLNLTTDGGQSPLILAAVAGNSRATLQLLLMQPDLDGRHKNCQGDTARDVALRNGNCVRLFDLLEPGLTRVEQD